MSGTASAPEGITNPPIDELLERRYRRLRGYGAYEAA